VQRAGGLSQHPADQIVRALIASARPATPTEIQQILDRLATAPFDPRALPVPTHLRGVTYQGHTLGSREAAIRIHLVQRVIGDEQWRQGTTAPVYIADIQRAVRAASAQLVIYERRGGAIAAKLTPTGDVLPVSRQGRRTLPLFFVVYSADRGTTTSGYQATAPETLSIPGDARWLR
jgi:hypothetical protein